MTVQRKSTETSIFLSFTIFVSLSLCLIPLTTFAADTWSGNLPDGTRVELKENVKMDRKSFAYGLHYEGNWNCSVGAKKESKESKAIILHIAVTSGGKCDCLFGGKITIQLDNKDEPNSLVVESTCKTPRQEIPLNKD